ncbi:MAG TPA: hypothetical protein VHN79_06180 [Lacunisphaera sp.]|nr:hypothetical protein [Lacunisphaera sp.]
MTSPTELCPELQALLAEELVAGNRIVDCGRSPHHPQGVLVLLGADFKYRPSTPPPGVDYVEIRDPHWWKVEYVHRASGHVLAARFDSRPSQARSGAGA